MSSSQPRRVWRALDGVLLLDKPVGMSSNHALQAARRLLNAEKGGHTGTLDPLASGLLPLCFGEATKFAGELLDAEKTYMARVCLGIRTATGDTEGEVLEKKPVNVDFARIDQVLTGFLGEISQVPPLYSALKRDGKPLYAYARAGQEVSREARRVVIHRLVASNWAAPSFDLEVCCSKGTYIRTLAEDIGEKLGCGAHLSALRRTGVAWLDLSAAMTLDGLAAMAEEMRESALAGADSLLLRLPAAELAERETLAMRNGQAVAWAGNIDQRFRLYASDRRFLGLGRLKGDGKLHPERLVALK